VVPGSVKARRWSPKSAMISRRPPRTRRAGRRAARGTSKSHVWLSSSSMRAANSRRLGCSNTARTGSPTPKRSVTAYAAGRIVSGESP
jgi:hypothetical protein